MNKNNLTTYYFVIFFAVFGALILLFPGTSSAADYFIPDFGTWVSNPPICLPGTCGVLPYGDTCYNGPSRTDPGNCTNACQVFGDTWTQYAGECVLSPCKSGYRYNVGFMTGDKCISSEIALRVGTCSAGGYDRQYKSCCSGRTAVGCQSAVSQDAYSPPEGVCPGGYLTNGDTVVSCGGGGEPACGTAACEAAHPLANVTIQGYKVVDNSSNTTFVNPQTVSIDGGGWTSTANPYSWTGVGTNHSVSVSVPSGWKVGYSLCYDSTSCHSGSYTSGSSVTVSGSYGYADLWWHYDLTAQPTNLRVSGSPSCSGSSARADVAWNLVNGAMSYKVYLWSGSVWVYQGSTTNTSYTFTSLNDASGYTWGVEACGGNGDTSCSGVIYNSSASFTTPTCSASTLNVRSSPVTGVSITGDYPGTTNYTSTGSGFTGNLSSVLANDPVGYTFNNWTGDCASIAGRFCTVNFSGGQTKTVTANYTAAATLSVNLSASPASGTAPLTTTLSADVSGTATGTINYSFWWNCSSSSTSVSTVEGSCGSLPAPGAGSCASNNNGYKCNAVNTDPQAVSHSYSPAANYRAYVIAERGSAPAASDFETITVTGQPDLTVENLSYSPASPVAGNAMSFSGTVRNSGGVAAGASSVTRLRIDINNNGWTAGEPESTASTTNLAAGGTETETWSSVWTSTAGTHKFEICADAGSPSVVTESNESNNCTTQTFTVASAGQPDLVTQNLSYSPANPVAGNSMSFSGDVRNSGGVAAGSTSSTRLRIDINNDGSWDVTPVNNSTANLSAGGIETETWSSAWTATAGTHKFEICADAGSPPAVTESSESNNCTTQTFTVGTAGNPDLVTESLTFSPASPVVGSSMSFSGTVRNSGGVAAGASSVTRLRIDINNNGWTAGEPESTASTTNLAAGGTETETWSSVWTSTAGTHKFEICADAGSPSVVTESNESNNCTSQTFIVGCSNTSPDVPILSLPADFATGISTNPTVSWNGISGWGTNCAVNNNTYTVLLDTSNPPTTSKGSVPQSVTSLGITGLNNSTTYYWKVRASNGAVSVDSVVRRFTTSAICGNTAPSAPNLPSPSMGATGVSINPTTVSWQSVSSWGTNCAGNNNGYTVYLDTSSSPSTDKGSVGQSITSLNVNSLNPSTLYYWKVAASNGALSTDSPIWQFTTGTVSVQPSATALSLNQGNYCTAPLRPIFSWVFSDPDAGSTQSAYQVQGDNTSGFSSPEVDSGKVSLPSNSFAPLSGISYNNTYYWRVRVWDNTDTVSGWTEGASFTTPAHAYPDPSFTWLPALPTTVDIVTFTDTSICVGACQAWEWDFGDGGTRTTQTATHTYGLDGTYEVSLGVTDASGYSCKGNDAVINDITVGPAQPKWKEVPPFSWIWNIVMALGRLFARFI